LLGEVMAIAAENHDPRAHLVCLDAVAVELDFMLPIVAGRSPSWHAEGGRAG
jgi:hypothetical protein